jgi:hypothetical protein
MAAPVGKEIFFKIGKLLENNVLVGILTIISIHNCGYEMIKQLLNVFERICHNNTVNNGFII